MLPHTLRTRGMAFAYLFGPPRFVPREDASFVHNKVCDRLKLDDIAFQYSTSAPEAKPSSKGFAIRFERKEGRGAFLVLVENSGTGAPMRLLMSHDWPPSVEHVVDVFDPTAEAVFESLEGPWQKVLAEVRIRAQCDVRENNGLKFLTERILNLNSDQLRGLGDPLVFSSVKLEIEAVPTQDSLANPKREVSLEVLREDPRGLFLEFVSQWAQVPTQPSAAAIDLSKIRAIDQKPSAYVKEAHEFLSTHVMALGIETK